MKNLKYLLSLLMLLFTITLAQNNSTKIDNNRFKQTDTYVQTMIDSLQIVGLNYAILVDNELVHQNSFGVASKQLAVPMTIDKVFPVASISKLFSSVALHKLLAIQNRNVEETVGQFLPDRKDLPDTWRALTLRQLLSHTSGIPDQIDCGIYLAPESEQFVIESLKDKPFSSKPGTESKYNATGFLLVRMIMEQLAEQDFESCMHEHFFDKFGLTSAIYGGFKAVIPKRVTCYQNVEGKLQMFPLNYSSPMYAGAGLNISMEDLVKWIQLVFDEQILSREQLSKIWEPVKLNNGEYGNFGLGWESYKLDGGLRIVGHGGAGISAIRHYWNDNSDENVTVILLTNGALNWVERPNQIANGIASIILGE
ncbi:MAG: serine hydrolase [Melioribacteraceae bacterium]|nr:MAG: serine hydrolase [Melioribacteraceae bacterium]